MAEETSVDRKLVGMALLWAFVAIYDGVALLCLRQANSPDPWVGLDVFSGGFLLLTLLWAYSQSQFQAAIFRSREVVREAAGVSYDAGMPAWITVLSLFELTVFFDYGHWRLVPQLVQLPLQAAGLALSFVAALWLVWTDRHLARHFSGDLTSRKLMTEGPYHFVRHPRYAALLASRVAFALALASILAWIFLLGWLWLVMRRVRLEETHMRGLFGSEYETFASRTARLLPGIY